MSYSIIVEYKNGKNGAEIPFSSNKRYYAYWLPLIEKLNLRLLEDFQSGLEILDDDHLLEALILDFEKIKELVQDEQNKDRINYILCELRKIEKSECSSIYLC